MQDPKISAALSVMMGINLMGDDDKMDTEPSPPPKPKREPTPPPPEKTADESLSEEQKQVFINLIFVCLICNLAISSFAR